MTTRTVPFVETEFYHIFNRGTDKRLLYQSELDFRNFIERMYLSNSNESINVRDIKKLNDSVFDYVRQDSLVAIGAYCLMPNHFHLLVTPLVEGGVTKFMSKLMTGYSMYFNKKYERTGTLYEGPFKAKHASYDEYLKYLYSYIHLNPAKLMSETDATNTKEATLDFLRSYKHSSYQDYIGIDREEGKILNPAPFPDYFTTSAEHIEQLKTWLEFNPDKINLK